MTNGIEKTLNLRSLSDVISEEDPELAEEMSLSSNDEEEFENDSCDSSYNHSMPALTSAAGILSNVQEQKHNSEMDKVNSEALQSYEHIFKLAQNVNPERSARLFEVAGQFLKLAMDSSNSKADKQLQLGKLKIATKRMNIDAGLSDQIAEGKQIMMDRNHLLKELLDEARDVEVIDADIDDDNQ